MNSVKYHVRSIAQKLLSLKSANRLNKADQEIIAEILDTDVPLIQKKLKNESKAG